MKLTHPDFFCQIIFEENYLETIIIEKPSILAKFIIDINASVEGEDNEWKLSHEGSSLKISKVCEILSSPINITLNSRKLVDALHDCIIDRIKQTELFQYWGELCSIINQKMSKFLADEDFAVEYLDYIEMKKFLKLMDVKYVEEGEDYFEKLLIYFRMARRILGIELFLLVGFKMFLNVEQLEYLRESMSYEKYQILLVEGSDAFPSIVGEHKTIIDVDSCVIR